MSKETLLQIDTDQELAKIIQKMNTLHDQLAAPDIFRKALNAAGRKVRKQMVADAKEQYAIKDTKALKDKAKGAPEFLTHMHHRSLLYHKQRFFAIAICKCCGIIGKNTIRRNDPWKKL